MIPVLRSLDSLLNRFDELSLRHASLASTFETNFSDVQNPLHDVSRDENEQRKTAENLQRINLEDSDDDQLGSFGTVDGFHRRITKSRSYNRPPSYSSNDSNSFLHRIPSGSSWATIESAPPPRTLTMPGAQERFSSAYSQTGPIISNDTQIESRSRQIIRPKPRVLVENSPPSFRRQARTAATTFTLETAIRLSKPRRYNRLPEPIVTPKHVHRRPKPPQARKKEAPESSTTSIPRPTTSSPPLVVPLRIASPLGKRTRPPLGGRKEASEPTSTFFSRSPRSSPPLLLPRATSPLSKRTKSAPARKKEEFVNIAIPRSPPLIPPRTASPTSRQANPTIIKSSLKKPKVDNKSAATDNSKQFPLSNYPRPAIILAPPPTICLTFPMQPELKSSRVVVIPKGNPVTPVPPAKKTVTIFTNKRTIIPPTRMMYLMT